MNTRIYVLGVEVPFAFFLVRFNSDAFAQNSWRFSTFYKKIAGVRLKIVTFGGLLVHMSLTHISPLGYW